MAETYTKKTQSDGTLGVEVSKTDTSQLFYSSEQISKSIASLEEQLAYWKNLAKKLI